ncbi:MAG: hypothetical protein HOL17_06260 [Gammaproteobacteria bacterium]|jgi:hypothetical protein|nr:hypothetical protein [Gammaproteobacteria bacterium]MBT4606033.1 hypothetical protein [Thiotrichales bacterium]MBT7829785.1 hypothetical protein [Candidatus Neomarinimicrobiota bacterium]MBT4329547.1 hypothetical protein [Gammaproteobacteria bacterium]MBT5371310.1 hypothetical protein [Gammaproteobacteria bacterium]
MPDGLLGKYKIQTPTFTKPDLVDANHNPVSNSIAPDIGSSTFEAKGPASWGVDDKQTVQGQLNGLLGSNNPLLKKARERAARVSAQKFNARGLLNSSMAVQSGIEAGDNAFYANALPIAQADAGVYGDAAKFNSEQQNEFAVDQNDFMFDSAKSTQDYRQDFATSAAGHDATLGQGDQSYEQQVGAGDYSDTGGIINAQTAAQSQLQSEAADQGMISQTQSEAHQSSAQEKSQGFQAGESAAQRGHEEGMQDSQQEFELVRQEKQLTHEESQTLMQIASNENISANEINSRLELQTNKILSNEKIDLAQIASQEGINEAQLANKIAVNLMQLESDANLQGNQIAHDWAVNEAVVQTKIDIAQAQISSNEYIQAVQHSNTLTEIDKRAEVDRANLEVELDIRLDNAVALENLSTQNKEALLGVKKDMNMMIQGSATAGQILTQLMQTIGEISSEPSLTQEALNDRIGSAVSSSNASLDAISSFINDENFDIGASPRPAKISINRTMYNALPLDQLPDTGISTFSQLAQYIQEQGNAPDTKVQLLEEVLGGAGWGNYAQTWGPQSVNPDSTAVHRQVSEIQITANKKYRVKINDVEYAITGAELLNPTGSDQPVRSGGLPVDAPDPATNTFMRY